MLDRHSFDYNPGFAITVLDDCWPFEQLLCENSLIGAIDAAKLMAAHLGVDDERTAAIEKIGSDYALKRWQSCEAGYAFGLEAARRIPMGRDWASTIGCSEGCHYDRATHLVETAAALENDGYSIHDIMMGIETISQLHAHHSRAGEHILTSARQLSKALPGFSIDEWTVTCEFRNDREDHYLATAIQSLSRTKNPNAFLALVHWHLLRTEEAAIAKAIPYETPEGCEHIRAKHGVARFMVMRAEIYSRLSSEDQKSPPQLAVDCFVPYNIRSQRFAATTIMADMIIESINRSTKVSERPEAGR